MTKAAKRDEAIDAYLNGVPATHRAALKRLRRQIKKLYPKATEHICPVVTMSFAKTLEAFPRLSWSLRRVCRVCLRPFRNVVNTGRQTAFDRFDTKW